MVRSIYSRWMLVAAALCVGGACAGQGLPSVQPTGGAAPPAAAASGGARSTRRADVDYTGGLLRITANNSSLNQILREVGRLTGMKITGGVQEDRVFGSYGPAPASEVLATLLDGTASNLLIVNNDINGPAELILTPRHGGASPPNPNAASLSDDNDGPPPQRPQEQSVPAQGAFQNGPPGLGTAPGGLPASNGGQTGTPVNGGANLGTVPGAFAGYGQTPPDATAQPAAPASGDGSGVATPQQIYEQLQRLRQQQPAPAQPQ